MAENGKYLLALDQGTTSSRAIIFDSCGAVTASAQKEFEQLYTGNGWVEHRPKDILSSQIFVMKDALTKSGLKAEDIFCIGIANQRETTVVWDKKTGIPVYNAIVWQCRRTAEYCDNIRKKYGKRIYKKTGLKVDAYFSASKINWILNNVGGAKARAEAGDLLFGTIDTFLLWNLSGGKAYYTDYTNASRTMLFNIHTLKWDEELLKIFGIPKSMLPEVKPSGYRFGDMKKEFLGAEISITALVGDQQSALYGQLCWDKGNCKNTYGTGCFMLMNTGDKPVKSRNGLITTLGATASVKPPYVLEGSVFVGGAAVQWLRDGLKIIKTAAESEKLATSVADSDGVYVVPAFVGLGAPYWDSEARGVISGITRGTTAAHVARAALEGIALEVSDVIKAMESDLGAKLSCLRVDGGASANGFLMRFQADILGVPVVRPSVVETTALGAVYLAGLASGYFKNNEEIVLNRQGDAVFQPNMPHEVRKRKLDGWKKAVIKARG